MDEKLYTLEEARKAIAYEKCAMHGHNLSTIMLSHTNEPHAILCLRCGSVWDVVRQS